MKERVGALIGAAARVMWVMTFHSACARILRQHADRLAYKRGFTIYDEADSRRMVKRCMDELEIDPKRFPPRSIKGQISGAKNRLRDAETLREEQGSFFEATVADVYELYEKRMHDGERDGLRRPAASARSTSSSCSPTSASATPRNFRHVLVDEYQDTNRVQYRLLQLLTGEHGNLFVVGDESQSVYGFRAADIRNILDFERDFPEAATVKLEQNYRSTGTILDAANGLIAHNRDRLDKNLWTDAGRGDPVTISELADEHEEARWIAGEIDRLVDEEGIGRDDVAIFYRTNAQSRVLEDTLVRFDVPYQVIGGTKFYERAEIRDAIAYLSVLANPDDTVSLARIINSPRRGIGNTSEGRLLGWANTTGVSPLEAVGAGRDDPRARRRRREGDRPLRRADREPHRAGGAPRPRRRAARVGALGVRVHRGAGGGAAPSRPRAGSRTSRSWSAWPPSSTPTASSRARASCPPLEEFLEQISLINEQDALTDDATEGDADDAPQRQGPRVQGRVHDRLRGRRLPALPLDRRGQPRGGAPPLLRRPDPGPRVPDAHLRPPPQPLRRAAAPASRRDSSARSPPISSSDTPRR